MFPQLRAEPCTGYRDTPAAMIARWTLFGFRNISESVPLNGRGI